MTKAIDHFFSFVAYHRLGWLMLVCGLGIFADQASKIWAQQTLAEPYVVEQQAEENTQEKVVKEIYYPVKVIEVVPNFFNLIYKENPAAAFSLTHSIPTWVRRPMLISVSFLAVLFFLFWYFRKSNKDGILLFAFSFILAGAVGNLFDRIRLGYVIDFLDVYAGFLGYPYMHWPTFNVADSMIVVGAIVVIIRTLMSEESKNN